MEKSDTVQLSHRGPLKADEVHSMASFAAFYIGLVQAFSNTLTQHWNPKRTALFSSTRHFVPPVSKLGGDGTTDEVNYPKEKNVALGNVTLMVITGQVGSFQTLPDHSG